VVHYAEMQQMKRNVLVLETFISTKYYFLLKFSHCKGGPFICTRSAYSQLNLVVSSAEHLVLQLTSFLKDCIFHYVFFRFIISHMKEKSASSVTFVHMLPYLRDIWSLTC
jgi:hypothetical protein